MNGKRKVKYLKNKDLYVEILVSKSMGRLTPRAMEMLILLGKNIQSRMSYINLDDKKDCLQEAMFCVFKFWYNFDELKGDNAFSYFTEIIKRGLAKGWNNQWKLKGDDNVVIISLTGVDDDGRIYVRL